jgi:hypothetical protein
MVNLTLLAVGVAAAIVPLVAASRLPRRAST